MGTTGEAHAVRVKCPATSANLGSGFDLCGLALESPCDFLSASEAKGGGKGRKDSITFSDGFSVPSLENNVCHPVLKAIRKDFKINAPIDIRIEKNIPPSSGLGSSGASAAGTAVALNELFGLGLETERLVEYASLGEALVAGRPHKDNVAPAITGGVCVIARETPLKLIRFDPPKGLVVGIVQTNITKPSTKFAGDVLPESVARKDQQYNLSKFCLLLSSLVEGDASLFVESLDDRIAETAREKAGLLPKVSALKAAASSHGFAVTASGSGPSLLAAGVEGKSSKGGFESDVRTIFDGLSPKVIWTKVSPKGCEIV